MRQAPANLTSRRYFLKLAATSSLLLPASLSIAGIVRQDPASVPDHAVRDAIEKARDFDHDFASDTYLDKRQQPNLLTSLTRLERLRHIIGYANFNLLGFDEALHYAKLYSVIGAFTQAELGFIEEIFDTDARVYGFFGEKTAHSLTETIVQRDVIKLPGSGHYLYRGDAYRTFLRLQRDIGPQLQLTSGIRSIVKQLHLFLAKASTTHGNLSRAARQLAPPGHSFHGIGDFDVGQRGLGAANFTERFTHSQVYQRVHSLGYSNIRYPQTNPYGVRYEPWHIKVVKHA
jgi:D-alanyl-D-alanine carboxypeptidase